MKQGGRANTITRFQHFSLHAQVFFSLVRSSQRGSDLVMTLSTFSLVILEKERFILAFHQQCSCYFAKSGPRLFDWA